MSIKTIWADSAAFSRRTAADFGDPPKANLPDEKGTLRRRSVRSARELTRFTLNRKADARDVWKGALEVFEDGLNGPDAEGVLAVVFEVVDGWLELAGKSREWWAALKTVFGVNPELLGELAAAEKEALEVRAAAAKALALMDPSRGRPVDQERLRRGEEDLAAGRFKRFGPRGG